MNARRQTVAEIAKIQPPAPPPESPSVQKLMEVFVEVMEHDPHARTAVHGGVASLSRAPAELIVETETVAEQTPGGRSAVDIIRPKKESA